MTEHEQNLHDLYAGMAMIGMLAMNRSVSYALAKEAYDMAELMLEVRGERLDNHTHTAVVSADT